MPSILPKVSVIIPNYNHARFLPQRIESVLKQSFSDIEVLLMDDCSTDNSVEVLKKYAAQDKRIRLILNEQNSGSTFAQWNKGVAEARGEYVWIAESDDYCECTLLETLVPILDKHKNVGIAFAQSYIVDDNSEIINSFNENYKYIYKSTRWEHDFMIEGKKECSQYLIFSNTIPNASGALMRKSVYLECGGAETKWRLNGDWFFYVKMLLKSDLAYVSTHLNYFRKHVQTQRQKANADHVVYDEIIHTLDYINEHADVDPVLFEKAYKSVAEWWGGSLFRQKITKTYFKENWRLYKFFSKKRPRLGLNIISNSIFVFIGNVLEWLGIKKVVRKWRSKLFPGKYFEY